MLGLRSFTVSRVAGDPQIFKINACVPASRNRVPGPHFAPSPSPSAQQRIRASPKSYHNFGLHGAFSHCNFSRAAISPLRGQIISRMLRVQLLLRFHPNFNFFISSHR